MHFVFYSFEYRKCPKIPTRVTILEAEPFLKQLPTFNPFSDINDTHMELIDTHSPDLLHILGDITPLSASFQLRLHEQLKTDQFCPRHYLLHPGEISRRIYFIQKGLLRAFTLDRNGRQTTSWFFTQGELMISVQSFFYQKPAQEYLEVLAPSTVQSLSWNQLNSLYADFPESNLIGRILIQKYYVLSEQHNLMMRTQTPIERYLALLSRHPKIEQQTTQTILASYLGLSRESLSRMKTRLIRAQQQLNASLQQSLPQSAS